MSMHLSIDEHDIARALHRGDLQIGTLLRAYAREVESDYADATDDFIHILTDSHDLPEDIAEPLALFLLGHE